MSLLDEGSANLYRPALSLGGVQDSPYGFSGAWGAGCAVMRSRRGRRWLARLVVHLRWPGQPGRDEVSGFLVGAGDPRGIHLERR